MLSKDEHERTIENRVMGLKIRTLHPQSGIGIDTYHISNWRAKKERCGRGWNTWCILHHSYRQGYNHGTERNTGRNNGEDQTNHLLNFCYDWKQTDSPIRKIAEVTLRVPEECDIILWEAGVGPEYKRVLLLLPHILGRPPWPCIMLIIGWWYYITEQRLQDHYNLSLLLC